MRRSLVRNRRLVALALLVTAAGETLAMSPATASADPFAGTTKSYSGVPLHIRGFIDPKCLLMPGTQCHTFPAADSPAEPKPRHEATAQVITMHALGLNLGQPVFAVSPGGASQKVQWEVGPKRFGNCASPTYPQSFMR